jgi:uncharacterized protein with HEPN domain
LTSREQQWQLDVLLAAEDALSFVRDQTFEGFLDSRLTQRAVLHCLAIIGEAAGRIADSAESQLPDLPWRSMKDLRNVIVHQYERVNLPRIWKIVNEELPAIVTALDPFFPERNSQ